MALLDIVAQHITRNSSYLYEVYTTVCFILAMKYIEIDPPTPDYSEFKTLDGRNYIHSTDLYNYEVIILKELDYRLDVVTAYDVLGILFNCGFVYESETMNKPSEFLKTIYNYAKRVLDRAVENSNISEEYNAMQIAFREKYTARKTFGLNVKCRKDFKAIYGMNYSFYSSCVREIANIDNIRIQYNPTEANTTRKIKKIKLLQTEGFVDFFRYFEIISYLCKFNLNNRTLYLKANSSSSFATYKNRSSFIQIIKNNIEFTGKDPSRYNDIYSHCKAQSKQS